VSRAPLVEFRCVAVASPEASKVSFSEPRQGQGQERGAGWK